MHLLMILMAIMLAWDLRLKWSRSMVNFRERWQRSLLLFIWPPLLLILTATSVLCMGFKGSMVGWLTGMFSYFISICFLGWGVFLCFKLGNEGARTLQKTRTYPRQNIRGNLARILEIDGLFTAQIGFWQPELVISRGLLQTLDNDHLDAVLAHEQAHHYYRDTFWFFWLGWLRQIGAWLPNTEALWQELLILRELRADAKASQQIDPLLLAESLLMLVSILPAPSENFCAALSAVPSQNRLEERIEALLTTPVEFVSLNWLSWTWLLWAFLPLVAIPFHK